MFTAILILFFQVIKHLVYLLGEENMSRSHKYHPINSSINPWCKRWAKRKARRVIKTSEDLWNYNLYKRLYDGWGVRDWRYVASSFEDYADKRIETWNILGKAFPKREKYQKSPTKAELKKEYKKLYFWK